MKLSLSLVSLIAFVYCVFAKISIGAFSNDIMLVKDRFGIGKKSKHSAPTIIRLTKSANQCPRCGRIHIPISL